MEYLHARGVFIETTEERKASKEKAATPKVSREGLDPNDASSRTSTDLDASTTADGSVPPRLCTGIVHADARGEGDLVPLLAGQFATGSVNEGALNAIGGGVRRGGQWAPWF